MDEPTNGTVASRYEELSQDRQPFLDRARECSKYTIPSLIPPEGHTGTNSLYKPFQSLGARGVNNLASKLLLALIPPGSAFFRLAPGAKVQQQLQDGEDSILDHALSMLEQTVLLDIEARGFRAHAGEGFKHLIVGGNVLVHLATKGVRVFPLAQYVVHRDPEGNVLEIIVKEIVSPKVLPASVREQIKNDVKPDEKPQKTVDIYTHVRLNDDGKQWRVCQEVKGKEVPESEGTYPLDKNPWLPLRWTRIDGESYGRGLCEEYIGDLMSLEGLSKSIVEFAAIAAKVIFLTNPNGQTQPEVLMAATGAVRTGLKDDISIISLEKYADFQVAKAVLDGIEQRLAYAFLLHSAIQRKGERVTAEEIRTMAKELEDAFGGVYSVLSVEFQLPLVTVVMAQLQKKGSIPTLPKDAVHPTILTGLDALGRNQELARLDAFLSTAVQKLGPQVYEYINISDYLTRNAAALSIKMKGLIRTQEEVAASRQAAQQQAMAEKLGPAAIQAGAKIATTPTEGQPQPE